jgi:putative tryptophan/tyrosine transport system substrate-binding protein
MRLKRHFSSIVTSCLMAVLIFGLGGCSKEESPKSSTSKTVMVNQYVTQPILDAVLAGMQERLSQEAGIDVIVKNSNADAMTCRQINEQFIQQNPSLIVALGTPAAQSAVQVANGKVPVVFGAITDPVGAKLADSLERPGGNKTGTTNRWPFDDQVRLVHELLPNAKTIGVIVNPGEDNCNAGVEVFRQTAKKLGLTLVETPATNSSEVKTAASVLTAKKVDVILISPSNTLFSALNSLISTAHEAGIPVIGGDESAVERGSVATYGFSNKDVGIATAEIVLEVLKGEKTAGTIPVARPRKNRLFVNTVEVKKAGITIPESLRSSVVAK